jgi:malonyl CoA-acyl carrier protein transacylase
MPKQQKLVFPYSGQGSQYYHMGQELLQRAGPFRRNATEVNALFLDSLKVSTLDTIYDPKRTIADPFDAGPSGILATNLNTSCPTSKLTMTFNRFFLLSTAPYPDTNGLVFARLKSLLLLLEEPVWSSLGMYTPSI